jgi:hypothetical protein
MDNDIHLYTATIDGLVYVCRLNRGILGRAPTCTGAVPLLDTNKFPHGCQPISSEALMSSGSPSIPEDIISPQQANAEVSLLIGCGVCREVN